MLSIASILSVAMVELINRLLRTTVFPVFAENYRMSADRLGPEIRRYQSLVLMFGIPTLLAISLSADFIIELLYDERYWRAGEFLQLLALSASIFILPKTYMEGFLAEGNSRLNFAFTLAMALLRILGLLIGVTYFGVSGMLIGIGIASFLGYLIVAVSSKAAGRLCYLADFSAICAIIAGYSVYFII